MEPVALLKFFFAFVFVICLMLLCAWVVKRMGLTGTAMMPGAKRRLKIVEYLPLDNRRRAVLIRRDDREHLVIIGSHGETVVEANIPALDNVVDITARKEGRNV